MHSWHTGTHHQVVHSCKRLQSIAWLAASAAALVFESAQKCLFQASLYWQHTTMLLLFCGPTEETLAIVTPAACAVSHQLF